MTLGDFIVGLFWEDYTISLRTEEEFTFRFPELSSKGLPMYRGVHKNFIPMNIPPTLRLGDRAFPLSQKLSSQPSSCHHSPKVMDTSLLMLYICLSY